MPEGKAIMDQSKSRSGVIDQLADLILSVRRPHPVRVAIDGVDAAGKTVLGNELATVIEKSGRPVIRASMDGFHNPRLVRYRLGTVSPEGYYRDSFDIQAILRELLLPLGPGGDRQYRSRVYDYKGEVAIQSDLQSASRDAILLVDGIFLLRPELAACWDFSVFVEVTFEVSVSRGIARDTTGRSVERMDGHTSTEGLTPESLREKYDRRYVPGQRIYLHQVKPKEKASVVLDNNDWDHPNLILT
jgi:uridine kinase